MLPIHTRKPNWRQPIGRGLFVLATSIVLMVGGVWPGKAQGVNSSPINRSEEAPPNVGSIAEYMEKGGNPAFASYLPLFGIHVFEGRGELASGQSFSGLCVTAVDRPGPADDVGIRAEHIRVLRTATEVGASALLAGAILVFPPAIVGVAMIPDMGSTKAYDVIVAVDGERTRNTNELENSLRCVKAGEVIYLTIIRDGRRAQLRLLAPATLDPHSPRSPTMLSR